MGPSHLSLVPGSDCPDTATYFDFSHLWDGHDVQMNENSACVFEMDMGKLHGWALILGSDPSRQTLQ